MLLREQSRPLKPRWSGTSRRGCQIDFEELEHARTSACAARRGSRSSTSYDLLLTPATVVAPYPVEHRYVAEVNGHKFGELRRVAGDRLRDHCAVRHRAVIALRVHAGRSYRWGSLQIAGPPRSEARVRRRRQALEDVLGVKGTDSPIDPRVMHG